ncbi:NifB/NifX family molybdenum-iron cluster-binding protein [Desulfolithobacter sp.]
MEESLRLAVPSNSPGGLEATRSDHFGHCDAFTLIDISEGKIIQSVIVPNQDHGAGGCMVPVQFLREQNVDAIVVGGIGARPLQGFAEVGIAVYYAANNSVKTVQAAVDGIIKGSFPLIRADQACSGHGSCH